MNARLARCIIILLAVAALAMAAQAATLDVTEERCKDDGSFSFTISTRDTDAVKTGDIRIAIEHPSFAVPYSPIGEWSREDVYFSTTATREATFAGPRGSLNATGTYKVRLAYEGCSYPPCEKLFDLDRCPGFPYSCELSKAKVDSCETKDGKLVVRYSGLNKGQHELLDPSALTLFINSDQRTNLMGVPSVPGGEYAFAGTDRYTLTFPLVTNEHVASTGVIPTLCKEDFQPTKAMTRCDQPAKAAPTAPPSPEEEPVDEQTIIEPVSETITETLPAEATPPIQEEAAEAPEAIPSGEPARTKLIVTLPDTTTLVLIGVIVTLAIIITVLVFRGRKAHKVVVVEEKKRR